MFKSLLKNTDFLYQLPRSMNGQSCRNVLDKWVVWAVVEADLILRYRPTLFRFTSAQHFRRLLLGEVNHHTNWDVLDTQPTATAGTSQEPVEDLEYMEDLLSYEYRQTAVNNMVKTTLPRLVKEWAKFSRMGLPEQSSSQEVTSEADRMFRASIQVR